MTENDVKDLFGYNLKRLRKSRKLSQMDFANQLDMHFTFISDIENGKKWVSPETIAKIASFFNVEPYEFLKPKNFLINKNPTLESFINDLNAAINDIKASYGITGQCP